MSLLLIATAILAASGLPALAGGLRSQRGQQLAALLMVGGSVLGIAGVIGALTAGEPPALAADWSLPLSRFSVALDPLGAAFLLPILVVPALGAIYGTAYWRHPASKRKVCVFYGVVTAAMAMVVMARSSVLLLMAWEVMGIAAYFLCTAQDDDAEVCRAGWVYLICAHAGMLCLIACFALLEAASGSYELAAFGGGSSFLDAAGSGTGLSGARPSAIFVLALVGFGLKAGIMPLHVWLPGAHASAPSHVSAVMSGVLLTTGVYGVLRVGSLLPVAPPAWWGSTLIVLGGATAVLGIAYAVVQSDLKRLLAYSSVENLGIVFLGIGLAFLGRARGQPAWIALGVGGAVLHVWSHALIKSLLFAAAGSVLHATGTRSLDRLGGLGRRMPRTTALAALGCVAICGLPPLAAFSSELLIYLGLFSAGCAEGDVNSPVAAFGAVLLAMSGALSLAAFVKVLGLGFLGEPRTAAAARAHESPAAMLVPMAVLAAGVVLLGLAPQPALALLDRVAADFAPGQVGEGAKLAALVPAGWVSALGAALLALAGASAWLVRRAAARRPAASSVTWDCAFAGAPAAEPQLQGARVQYTGTSFSEMLLGLFGWAVLPARQVPRTLGTLPAGTPPRRVHFGIQLSDAVLDRVLTPCFRQAGKFLPWVHLLQRGHSHAYVFYFVPTVTFLLVWRWS